jgi:predicted nucleic acid-binding protein
MDAVALVRPDDSVFTMAGLLTGRHLRSLDALHITLALRAGCSTMVTYDDRQAVAARQAGLAVVAPA